MVGPKLIRRQEKAQWPEWTIRRPARADFRQDAVSSAGMGMFELIKALADGKVDYVLVGGLAVALQGYQRVTMDVDIVLAMDEANLSRFVACARSAGLQPVIPVSIESIARPELLDQWHREKGMLAFGLRHPSGTSTIIDILIKPKVPYADLQHDATLISVGPIDIPVASIDHLITMKTGTGRGKDLIDIEELRRIQASRAP